MPGPDRTFIASLPDPIGRVISHFSCPRDTGLVRDLWISISLSLNIVCLGAGLLLICRWTVPTSLMQPTKWTTADRLIFQCLDARTATCASSLRKSSQRTRLNSTGTIPTGLPEKKKKKTAPRGPWLNISSLCPVHSYTRTNLFSSLICGSPKSDRSINRFCHGTGVCIGNPGVSISSALSSFIFFRSPAATRLAGYSRAETSDLIGNPI